MGCGRYEVVLIAVKSKKEQRREWTAADLVRSVPWLKRMNARGHDVLVAPAGEHALVLLDGLSERIVDAMRTNGFEPAATIQTAPGRVQAWVKLSDRTLPADVHQYAIAGLKRAFEVEGSGDEWLAREAGRLHVRGRRKHYETLCVSTRCFRDDCPRGIEIFGSCAQSAR